MIFLLGCIFTREFDYPDLIISSFPFASLVGVVGEGCGWFLGEAEWERQTNIDMLGVFVQRRSPNVLGIS